mmetsp:Transcript_20310/g.26314  ORF Transcript_20310/g.26314 Transcript_20310/m.26314 type:complete len:183 (-) Transcript_20310:176-724(-)
MRPPRTMSGRGGGRGKGSPRGFGGKGGRMPEGPPERVVEVGLVMHACEGDIVCKLTNANIPYFNASIYVDKDTRVGKVDEVFGPINAVMFTVKPETGVLATSFKADDRLAIDPTKLLPLSRFTNPPPGGGKGGGRGSKGGGRGKGVSGRGKGGKGGKGGRSGGRGSPMRGGTKGGRGGRGRP